MSRLKSSRGMTFMELLCAVLILMMSTALVLVGVNLALTMVSVILGIVCMVNPFHTALALARMLGVALLLYAVMEAVGYAQLRKVGRAVEDAVNRTAPIIDENARVLDDQDESVK